MAMQFVRGLKLTPTHLAQSVPYLRQRIHSRVQQAGARHRRQHERRARYAHLPRPLAVVNKVADTCLPLPVCPLSSAPPSLPPSSALPFCLPGPTPPDFYDRLISQAPVPREDTQPSGNAFGAVKRDVAAQYSVGQTVSVLFYGANPRNNFMTGGTFLEIEYNNAGNWTVVRRDSDYDTEFRWIPLHESNALQFISDIEIVWLTDATAQRTSWQAGWGCGLPRPGPGCAHLAHTCAVHDRLVLHVTSRRVPHPLLRLPPRREREHLPVHRPVERLPPGLKRRKRPAGGSYRLPFACYAPFLLPACPPPPRSSPHLFFSL